VKIIFPLRLLVILAAVFSVDTVCDRDSLIKIDDEIVFYSVLCWGRSLFLKIQPPLKIFSWVWGFFPLNRKSP